ncbi:Receptor-like protein kinase FERONIA [Acorus calamus]|uniref:Receptor-like protein kinase FERONIA n=1 Tax=Acorus calamus TaxID=4465 RepID=A0AAV9C647_ACOCL|nr:Receptor-like protein kinase FERONIA [Acorus calamus]
MSRLRPSFSTVAHHREKLSAPDGRIWLSDVGSNYAPGIHTLRIFQTQYTYSFPVTSGFKFVRLYFYPSNYTNPNFIVSDSFFSISHGPLLNNFNPLLTTQAINKEFSVKCVNTSLNTLNLTFVPSMVKKNAFAFVNGIEIISIPQIFSDSYTANPPLIVGSTSMMMVNQYTALETVVRLNVGRKSVSPIDDSGLYRAWTDDEMYIYSAVSGVTYPKYPNITIDYTASISEYIAPPEVYGTARSMGPNGSLNLKYNLTWVVKVDPGFQYLVRLHFCDGSFTRPSPQVEKKRNRHLLVIAIGVPRSIKIATNNFSDSFVLGVGGFGNVYQGKIDGGSTRVAVKRGSRLSNQGDHEFQMEIGAKPGTIHRDVKTTNILLDDKWVEKVVIFGLSKAAPELDCTHVSTAVKGSFGYLDPEYFWKQKLTEKSDVYSFGVVLFEMLCGRPTLDHSLPDEQVSLSNWALHCKRNGTIVQIINPNVKDDMSPDSLEKFVEIAEKCLAGQGIERPSMGDVLWNLEEALHLHIPVEKGESNCDPISISSYEGMMSSVVTREYSVFSESRSPKGRSYPSDHVHVDLY